MRRTFSAHARHRVTHDTQIERRLNSAHEELLDGVDDTGVGDGIVSESFFWTCPAEVALK